MKIQVTRYDDEVRLKLKHYDNLREYYNSLINEILGEDYYTVNPNVMQSDIEAGEDMIYRVRYLKYTIKCKNVQIVMLFIISILFMVLLFLASMHIIF